MKTKGCGRNKEKKVERKQRNSKKGKSEGDCGNWSERERKERKGKGREGRKDKGGGCVYVRTICVVLCGINELECVMLRYVVHKYCNFLFHSLLRIALYCCDCLMLVLSLFFSIFYVILYCSLPQ